MEIRQYAALVDSADMVISGDTGIVHIVASKRNANADNNKNYFRNKTALVTIVGSSDSRIYGYDSENEMYLGTSQNAPSKIFESKAPCRNIACIDKIMKTCRENRCFTDINPSEISNYIIKYFAQIANHEPAQKSFVTDEMITSSYDD